MERDHHCGRRNEATGGRGGQKVTTDFQKRSDGGVSMEKDHYCGRRSKATGGRGGQKVTIDFQKRSDGGVSMEKDHHCGRRSEATGGCGRQKVTHISQKARPGKRGPENEASGMAGMGVSERVEKVIYKRYDNKTAGAAEDGCSIRPGKV